MFFDSELRPKAPAGKGKSRKPGSKSLAAEVQTADKHFVDLIEVFMGPER